MPNTREKTAYTMSKSIDKIKPITSLKGYRYPNYLLFFDTESLIDINEELNDEQHTLRLGVAIYVHIDKEQNILEREVYHFKTAGEFWKYADSKTVTNNILYIYAHNAKYDTLNVDIIYYLDELGYTSPHPTINNAFIISAKKSRKTIKIVDTFNYVRTSVENMGSKLDVPKINLDEYRTKPTKKIRYIGNDKYIKGEIDFNSIPDKALLPYCENDVVIIERFMLSLIKLLNREYKGKKLGSLKYTTSGIALDIYRHSFINNPIYYHTNDDLLKLERAGYRGGIVECFKLGKIPKGKYYLLDINSMYVNVMSKYKLPLYPKMIIGKENETTEYKKIKVSDLINSIDNGNYIIADVLLCVEINLGKYGLKHDDKLIFPKGEFRITLHLPELVEAVKNKIITHVYQYAVYHQDYCLNEYSSYFSELKKNTTNKVDYDFAKLLGNGLYGRFGMRKYLNDELEPEVYQRDSEPFKKENRIKRNKENKEYLSAPEKEKINTALKEDYDLPAITTSKGTYIGWGDKYTRTYTDDFMHVPRTNVALAGAVTAYARINLSAYIETSGIEHIYYSDTDSLMVDEYGYENLKDMIDEKELGKLKCEMIFNSGNIKAPKNYTFSQKTKLNILHLKNTVNKTRLKHSNILLLEQKSIILKRRDRSKGIPNGAINHDGQYLYWRFTTFKEYLKSNGLLKGRHKHTRINSLEYTKGNKHINIKQKRGFITEPFTMEYSYNEDEQKWSNQIVNSNQQKMILKKKPKKQKKILTKNKN